MFPAARFFAIRLPRTLGGGQPRGYLHGWSVSIDAVLLAFFLLRFRQMT